MLGPEHLPTHLSADPGPLDRRDRPVTRQAGGLDEPVVEVQQLGLPTGHPLLYEFDPAGPERDGLLVPLVRGGVYLDAAAALAAAERLAREGGT